MKIVTDSICDHYYWEELAEKVWEVQLDLGNYSRNPHHYQIAFIVDLNKKLEEVKDCLNLMAESLKGDKA
jgi:hypothetical protein